MYTRSIRSRTLSSLVVLAAASWQVAPAAQSGDKPDSARAAPSAGAWKGDPYMLPTDALTGDPLGPIEKQVKIEVEGREFRFANRENADKFKADAQKSIAAVDEKMIVSAFRNFAAASSCVPKVSCVFLPSASMRNSFCDPLMRAM